MVQRLDDGEIAGMLGNDETDVRAQREEAMRGLAQRVDPESAGAPMAQIETTVARALEADTPPEPELEEDDPLAAFIVPAEAEEPEPSHLHAVPDWLEEPEYEPRPREKEPQSRKRILLTLLGLLVVLAVIVGIQRAGGSGSDQTSAPEAAPSAPAPSQPQAQTPPAAAKAPQPKPTKLTAIGNTSATGTIAVRGGELTMNVKGLPEGNHTVWLYNSVIDSKPLGSSKGTTIKLEVKLPADAKNYKFIDVSAQPDGSSANHSGESVLRTPTP